jgi:hypothetical protein
MVIYKISGDYYHAISLEKLEPGWYFTDIWYDYNSASNLFMRLNVAKYKFTTGLQVVSHLLFTKQDINHGFLIHCGDLFVPGQEKPVLVYFEY